ncbi:hypothetical protein SAMN05216480_12353 [Pustulibacterium marinum]|uniref:Uncharacterized protein n=1 Tax=Pustulibacterium marinum TaxID=1224947 RepID=A0A1I7IWT9_9FLAO|nr:hypothetical protein [Pustulibacterium marinum]SFU77393.1 hypothetical protein SAMN05216480_12353 [Pustulibacterium marinum]
MKRIAKTSFSLHNSPGEPQTLAPGFLQKKAENALRDKYLPYLAYNKIPSRIIKEYRRDLNDFKKQFPNWNK